ncbi:hypothetical protein ACOMHN_055164 [Nucella lapillus]
MVLNYNMLHGEHASRSGRMLYALGRNRTEPNDNYKMGARICNLYSERVHAVIATCSPTTYNTIQSYSHALHVPFVLASRTRQGPSLRYRYDVSLAPPLIDAVIRVIASIPRNRKVYYVYDNDDGLWRLQRLYQFFQQKPEMARAVDAFRIRDIRRAYSVLRNFDLKEDEVKTIVLDLESAEAYREVMAQKEAILENFLKDLPVVPAALFKIMTRKKKLINWDTEKEAMELCLAVYFRSTSAYAVLRSVGFQLPHPRTLRRRFSTVLTGVGLCQSLFEMMRLRTLALEEHEKRVTLSLDGMTVTKALTYSHHRDELVGFVNCGEYHQSDEIADQAILVMIRGLTLKWKQVLGYFVAKHNLATPTLTAIISEIVRTVTGIAGMEKE